MVAPARARPDEVPAVKHLVVLPLLALTAQASAGAAAPLKLADHGRSSYRIVIAAQAPPAEQRAAEELQRFLEQMSGARLPIVTGDKALRGNLVLVGDSAALRALKLEPNFDRLGTEGFVLRTVGRHLIIAGGRPRGTLYGVYTFLDQLGCRWFTREVSRIPKRPTLEIAPLDQTHRPGFEYREPFFTEAWDKDWAARNRTNGDHTQLDASTGGKLQYYPFVHSFNELVPPEKYFKDHPEYFSLIDGKRRAERSQLCLTNPDVLRIAVERVGQWIKEHPEATIFSVSQNDWEGWCECDHCRRVEREEGDVHSGPLLRFVNAVAAEIGKTHPDKLIDTLAYWYTEDPPAHVRPLPNVRIRLCPIGICVAHSFGSCPRSRYFLRNLEAWSKITNQLYIWHYNTNFSHYQMPMPDFDELAADVPLYHKHGVVGLFLQGAYPPGGGGENSELRAYVLARQLWDPATDVSRTVDEFLEGVYGPAAVPLREYYELLHKEVRAPAGQHLWIFNVPDYSRELLERAPRLFTRALALAPDEATYRRVLQARLPLEYYEILHDLSFQLQQDSYGPAHPEELVARARDLFARMRSFGIQSIHEGQTFDRDEARLAEWKKYPVVTLDNGAWRAAIVPDLGARVVSLVEKATGTEALRRLPPGEGGYPNVGGITTAVHSGYHDKAWEVRWAVESRENGRLVLHGSCPNGVRLRRTFELTAGGLRTDTLVENPTSAPVTAAVELRAEFAPGSIDEAAMGFKRVSGETVEKRLLDPDREPTGKETWTGTDRPSTTWRLRRPGLDALETSFDDTQVGRAYFNWTAKSHPGVTYGLWSPEKTLAPGGSLRLAATYGGAR